MAEALLEVRRLKKYFPIWQGVFRRQVGDIKAVDGVDLTVHKRQTVGLVGESGCGKSTCARVILRLLEPTSGSVNFLGKDLFAMDPQELRAIRPSLQIVFQDPLVSLNPRKSIGESLAEPLRFHGLAKNEEEAEIRVTEVLEQVGLASDVQDRYPHEFSGGQLQRICIGRAIIMKPKLIICDEAVSSLDISVQAQILNLLGDLQQQLDLSYLFIAHDLAVVRHFCDYVHVMYRGKIVESNTTEALFHQPQEEYTRKLLAAIPRSHPAERNR